MMDMGEYVDRDKLTPEQRKEYDRCQRNLLFLIFAFWLIVFILTMVYSFIFPAPKGEEAPQQTIEQPIETQVDEK